jgi:hypothetical protein
MAVKLGTKSPSNRELLTHVLFAARRPLSEYDIEDRRVSKIHHVCALQRLQSCRTQTLFLFVILASAGCMDRNFATVEGTVSLGGQPLDGGSVAFYPKDTGPISYSDIAPDGSYRLRTASRDGLLPGLYVATVSYRSGRLSPGMTLRQIEVLEKVPFRYCAKETSDLHEEVTPGRNSIDLNLTRSK